MATLQDLDNRQINEAVGLAVQRQAPLTVTVRQGAAWRNFHSRFLTRRGEHILIEPPAAPEGEAAPEFQPADKLGISFKIKHHKHLFTATVVGSQRYGLPSGGESDALAVCSPTRMQRLQRRAYNRVDVPPGRIVRAAFWPGGREAEPAGASAERPVWSGQVTNLSAGGFQLVAASESAEALETGEIVGVRVSFGAAEDAVFSDAQFRHVEISGGRATMGFQFLGLGQTAEGRDALARISAKVGEFQDAETRLVGRAAR